MWLTFELMLCFNFKVSDAFFHDIMANAFKDGYFRALNTIETGEKDGTWECNRNYLYNGCLFIMGNITNLLEIYK